MNQNARVKICEWTLFFLGLFFTAAFFVFLKIHNDHIQILNKAFAYIVNGEWSNYGNAGTGVGFVPGSFLTAVTAIPMSLWFSPYAAMAVIAGFHVISFLLLNKILKLSHRHLIILDLLLLFWLNPWRVEQSELYNPGYLFLFASLHFYTAFLMREKNFWLTFFHVLAVGFCCQVHYSALILIFSSFLLLGFQYLKVDWRAFVLAVALVILSLIPYFVDQMTNQNLAVTLNKSNHSFLFRNLIMVYPVIKSIAYWFRYGAIYFGRHIFSEINFDWVSEGPLRSIVSTSFHVLKWPVAAITLIASFRVQFPIFKRIWRAKAFARKTDRTKLAFEDRIYFYAGYLFVGMLVSASLSPVEFNHWHLILCFPIISVIMTLWFNSLRERLPMPKFKILFTTVLVIFILFNTFGFLGSRSHSYQANFHRDSMLYFEQWKKQQSH